MTTNNNDLAILQSLKAQLVNSFGLVVNAHSSVEELYQEIIRNLTERIKHFIRTDIDKLLQALYRIDIDDKLSDQAFELGEINQVSKRLAELIVQRQLQKLHYSHQFKQNK
jgi:hypothetical protein